MSQIVPEILDELTLHLDEDGARILERFRNLLEPYEVNLTYDRLRETCHTGDRMDEVGQMLDLLEAAMKDYYHPPTTQKTAYRTDLKMWFGFMRRYGAGAHFDELRAWVDYWPHIFAGIHKQRCGALVRSCRHGQKKITREEKHDFRGATRLLLHCPKCERPRRLCKGSPGLNGRCRVHAGKSSPMVDKAQLYAVSLRPNHVREAFYVAQADANQLSVSGEMAALQARYAELLGEVGTVDPAVLALRLDQAQNKLDHYTRGRQEPNVAVLRALVSELDGAIQGSRQQNARWKELQSLAVTIERLAKTEQARLVAAQRMMQAAEVEEEKLRIVHALNGIIDQAAHDVYRLVESGSDKVSAKRIGNMIRGQLAASIRLGRAASQEAQKDDRLEQARHELAHIHDE